MSQRTYSRNRVSSVPNKNRDGEFSGEGYLYLRKSGSKIKRPHDHVLEDERLLLLGCIDRTCFGTKYPRIFVRNLSRPDPDSEELSPTFPDL